MAVLVVRAARYCGGYARAMMAKYEFRMSSGSSLVVAEVEVTGGSSPSRRHPAMAPEWGNTEYCIIGDIRRPDRY